jgi:hypothetical protein
VLESHAPNFLFSHLIVTEYIPNANQTVYHCKEHYDIWDIDPNGLVMSHFKPFHKDLS